MIICPKCKHVRQADESGTPDWQCPACHVAYAKAAESALDAGRPLLTHGTLRGSDRSGRPWVKLALLLLLAWGAWTGLQRGTGPAPERGGASQLPSLSGELSVDDIRALAATVKAEDVVMYSTTECSYCAQAKAWLQGYGFPLTECNMSTTPRCQSEFQALGADGTPYLIVRGHHMKQGFDSDEFLAALR